MGIQYFNRKVVAFMTQLAIASIVFGMSNSFNNYQKSDRPRHVRQEMTDDSVPGIGNDNDIDVIVIFIQRR